MTTPKDEVFLASILGVCTSVAFTSMNAGLTYIAVPSLLLQNPAAESPSKAHQYLVRQWQHMYSIGSKAGPAACFLGAAAYLYAWTRLPSTATTYSRLLLFGVATSLAVPPFTFAVMWPTNTELHRRGNAASAGKEDEARPKDAAAASSLEKTESPELLHWWAQLNMIRGLLPALGAVGIIYGMTL